MKESKTNENVKGGKAKKILGVVGNILLWVFVAFAMFITICVFTAQNSADGVPSVFGKSMINIVSPSMDPTIKQGDLILVQKIDEADKAKLEVGTVITFHSTEDINKNGQSDDINTHRIAEVNKDTNGNVISYVTKGDNNPIADRFVCTPSQVIGVWGNLENPGFKIGGIGTFLEFLNTQLGFFLIIVLPLFLFFIYEIFNFVIIIVKNKQEKETANAPTISAIDEEEIKRRAVEEYLKQKAAEEAAKAEAAAKVEETVSTEETTEVVEAVEATEENKTEE